jgi:hypothetical protein
MDSQIKKEPLEDLEEEDSTSSSNKKIVYEMTAEDGFRAEASDLVTIFKSSFFFIVTHSQKS